jgi:hypothetical protein
VKLVGGGPFWIYDDFYHSVLHLAQFGYQQWPMTKLVVEVGPNYDQAITLRLREMGTGVLAWWTDAQTPPGAAVQTLVLNPQTNTRGDCWPGAQGAGHPARVDRSWLARMGTLPLVLSCRLLHPRGQLVWWVLAEQLCRRELVGNAIFLKRHRKKLSGCCTNITNRKCGTSPHSSLTSVDPRPEGEGVIPVVCGLATMVVATLVVSTVARFAEQTWTAVVLAALDQSSLPAFLPHSGRLSHQVMSARAHGLERAPLLDQRKPHHLDVYAHLHTGLACFIGVSLHRLLPSSL